MKILAVFTRLLMGLLLAASLAGCAGGRTYESTGEYIDDSVLTTKVKSAILADSRLKVMQINVKTFKGIVQLSGFVDSETAATHAVDVVRTIKGVKMVNNSLIVK